VYDARLRLVIIVTLSRWLVTVSASGVPNLLVFG